VIKRSNRFSLRVSEQNSIIAFILCKINYFNVGFWNFEVKTTMNIQYITDTKGRKSEVQLPLKYWEQIQKDLEELDRLRNKKLFMPELAEAVEEKKLIMECKKQARKAEDFISGL